MTASSTAPLLRWNLDNPVHSVAISHDGSRVVSGSNNCLVRIWDVRTGMLVLDPSKGHIDCVWSVAWSNDDSLIVSGSGDKTICIWDAKTGTPIGESLIGHAGAVFSVAFSPDSTRVVSCSKDKTIRIWNVRTGALMGAPLEGHRDYVQSVAFSPDNNVIVSGSYDKTIRRWDARTGTPIGDPLRGHTHWVFSVAFSRDGTRIVSGSEDKTIRLWDARTGAPLGEPLTGHIGRINSVTFSPDCTYVASASRDRTIRIWNARTSTQIGEPLRGHKDWVSSVAFSPDSTRIVTGSQDGTVCVWETLSTTSSSNTVSIGVDTSTIGTMDSRTSTSFSGLLTDTTNTTPSFDMVTSKMSIHEIFACLVSHGCSDLTSSANTTRSSAVITSGGFGDVRRLVMNDGTVVAIKTLRLHILLKDDDKAVKRAVREVYLWSRLRHVNIQELLGIMVFQGGLGMVSPWMEKGNLQQHIEAHPEVERHPVCVQVTSGVVYLHSIGMVHGDLKANNVLVSDDGTLKISDFDHAILQDTSLRFSATTRPGGGTLRWMAPELLQPEDEDDQGVPQAPAMRSKETDVYALGMTLLEILTGSVPYNEYKSDMGIYRAMHSRLPPKRPKELRIPEKIADRMWALLLKCWNHDPSARPDTATVLTELKSLAV